MKEELGPRLDRVNELLTQLIALTEDDIEQIKLANHAAVAPSVEAKNTLMGEFNSAKKELDTTLLKINEAAGGKLAEALDEAQLDQLGQLKDKLTTLHSKNKEYAKLVLIVKDFLDGLVGRIFHGEAGQDYGGGTRPPEALFRLKV